MDEPNDIGLLRRFVEEHSEAAFAGLVQREINLVYSVALRQTRNPHAADEITQAVFVVLARKAGSLLQLRTLTGWLYQAARLTSSNYLRTEARRARREQEAYMQSLMNESTTDIEEAWEQSAPLLEDAMGNLSGKDRTAILLRYFQNKSLREVGLALGINEDATRMRVNRALESLRRFFTRRGVGLSASAIAGALSTKSVHGAPDGLAASLATGAAQGTVLGSSVLMLAKGTLKLLAWARFRMLLGLSASATFAVTIILTVFLSGSNAGPQQSANSSSDASTLSKVDPFPGTASEGFDHLGITGAQQKISILGGMATVSNLTHGGALKIERSSSLDGVLVTPRSPPSMLGQLGISEWVFKTPVIRFGGYFQNNSRFDDAIVDFYDVDNGLIGSMTASVPKNLRAWTWNGWQSEVPIHRMVVTGNDVVFLNGFIWFDDVRVTAAPPPPCTIICPGKLEACNDPGMCGAVVGFAAPVPTNCAELAIACVPPTGSFFPVGTNPVLCMGTDTSGHVTNSCSFRIVVRDCEPPIIDSVAASPETLWPPDHKMQEVSVQVSAVDNCRLAGSKIISVTSNESTVPPGNGQTVPDWQITGDLTVSLRAERSAAGTGRVYSITVECTDESGNASRAVGHVVVPHDQR